MSDQRHVTDWIKGKRPEDFDVIESSDGAILWPTKLHRFGKGGWKEEPVVLQTLDGKMLIEAKAKALAHFEASGFKAEDGRVQDVWNELEIYSHVALAMREPKARESGVYPQKHTMEQLLDRKASGVSRAEVFNLHQQLQIFARWEDPRLEDIDTETAIAIATAIAEVRSPSPLAAIAGPAQDTCVVFIATTLCSYLRGERSAPSPASSTPDRSRSKS